MEQPFWTSRLNDLNGYWISDPQRIGLIAALLLTSPFLGWCIGLIQLKSLARIVAWLFTIISVISIEQLTLGEPAGTRMVLIIFALLFAMKCVVLVESQARLTLMNWMIFATLWFGMRPKLFVRRLSPETKSDPTPLTNQSHALHDSQGQSLRTVAIAETADEHSSDRLPGSNRLESQSFIRSGAVRVLCGLALIVIARWIWNGQVAETGEENFWPIWIATGLLLVGLSLIVHFGILLILVGCWRWAGFKCSPLFRAPLLSRTLSEFWGKRWNLAFSEMTALAVFRPVKKLLGSQARATAIAMGCAFVFSGLLHELAISVPVRAGFGWPMIYFALHGAAMFAEKGLSKLGFDLTKSVVLGRVWTVAWILIPLPLLFHRPFLEGCIWPILWPIV